MSLFLKSDNISRHTYSEDVVKMKGVQNSISFKTDELLAQDASAEQDLKIVRYKEEKTADGRFCAAAGISDRFNFVRNARVFFSPDGRTVSSCYCDCLRVIEKSMCRHITFLVRTAYDTVKEMACDYAPQPEEEHTEFRPQYSAQELEERLNALREKIASAEEEPQTKEEPQPNQSDSGKPEEYFGYWLDKKDEEEKPAEDTDEKNDPSDELFSYMTDASEEDKEEELPKYYYGYEPDSDTQDEDDDTLYYDEDGEEDEQPEDTSKPVLEPRQMNIILGTSKETGEQVIWRPNDTEQVFHTNCGIIGTMGTGKTQFTKSLITQLYREMKAGNNYDGSPLGILIFDYKGDYNMSKRDFIEATNAKVIRPYRIPYNPLALNRTSSFMPLLPVHTANTFKDTIARIYNLGHKQQQLLFDCILKAYDRRSISPGDPDTWGRREPTFDMVFRAFEEESAGRTPDSLTSVMRKLQEFCIFESDPMKTVSLKKLLDGVVVMDLSGYDEDIQSLIVAITLDQFYSQMHAFGSSRADGRRRQLRHFILVDEADNFLSCGFPSMKKIMKEGREFGVGVILSTQSLNHFGSGSEDYSKYILTWVIHNVSDLSQRDIEYVMKLNSKSAEAASIYASIKSLVKHESVVRISNEPPVIIEDKAFWQLFEEIK